jgi:hypothetical protein
MNCFGALICFSPHFSLSRQIDAQRGVAFRSTDFSLCAFRSVRRNSKPHRLKPVLLDLRRILVRNAD